jgi:hypothetical protein
MQAHRRVRRAAACSRTSARCPFSSASATISGQTGGLGSFANADPITMVSQQGVTRAVPSGVTGGSSFGVTWQHG